MTEPSKSVELFFSYWSEDRKAAYRKWQRAEYKLKCLEAAITRCDPEQFDPLMDQLEKVIESIPELYFEFKHIRNISSESSQS